VPFVLDVSVAVSWFFPDESHPIAGQTWLLIRDEDAIVPAHWWFEVRNTLLIGERRGRSSLSDTAATVERLSRMTIVSQSLPNDGAVFALARKHQLTFYDAVYLELAQRERLALATLDKQLAHAASAEGVLLVTGS
jgi:predicted nucleic acid-binding protein